MTNPFRDVYLEGLKGKQKKLDVDKDGKIEKTDLEKLRSEEIEALEEAGLKDACWKGYTAVGMKDKNGKKVPNCVPVKEGKDDTECACEEKTKCVCDEVDEGLKPNHNMRPGWMLKADPKLKAKVDANKKKYKEFKKLVGTKTNEEVINEGEYEKAEENKRSADAAKSQGRPFDYHMHMADHHDNMSQWHASKGRHGEADKHAQKSDEHHEKAMSVKESIELDEATPYYNKPSFLKRMGAAAKKERLAREKKEKEAKQVKEDTTMDEAKKANTASARQELSQRPRKELTGADADKKKKESDDAWDRLMAHAAANKKTNEEVSTKKPDPANKSDSPGFQAYLAKRRAEREKAKQATTTVKEGLGRGREDDEYHVPDPVDNRKKHTVKMKLSKDGGPVQHKQMDVHTIHGAEHAKKFAHSKAKEQGWTIHEEVELDEARVNGREYASHGLMHPDHAKMDIHKVSGQHVDFYASKTGDKMQGKVVKNDGKSVHIQAHKDKEIGDGKLHKFKVTPHLPKSTNEETTMEFSQEEIQLIEQFIEIAEKLNMSKASMGTVIKDFKASSAPQFAGKSDEKRRQMAIAAKLSAERGGKARNESVEVGSFAAYNQDGIDEAAWPGTPEYKKKFPETSRGKVGDTKVGAKGTQTVTSTGVKHERDYEKAEKETGSTETQEKRGRGRPKGSKSGAR